ncbi:MAG: NAD-dependent succinate-semialdehyde dehydrogenase, partial [Pelagibaca sp.]|nr:NAD-dependent succinate-semialdehyde dehydrogenase [Pelagibaca sp.]
ELARRAGFPEGVVNTVIGDAAAIVGEWTADTRVRALSFTGSTEVGRLLYRQSADTVKRLVLELGGHAPFIVFDDADLDRAVTEAVKAKFATSGQDCLGANRFYIQRAVYDDFCARFTKAVEALTLGHGMDDPEIGPLIHERAIEKQQAQVADAVEKGARLLAGGKVSESHGPLFFAPTVLADVPDSAAIMSEENFGPVAPLTVFEDEAEVIARANNTEYGLVAYVHSLDPRRIYRLTRALQFGMVAVNRTKVTGAPIPFGGTKQSGLGREGARQGLEAFTDIKYVCRDWG